MALGAVDSRLLLDICDGDPTAEQVLFMLRVVGFSPLLPPTATQELFDMAYADRLPVAIAALDMLSRDPKDHSKVYAPPQLAPDPNGYAGLAADDMFNKGFVSDKNLGLIISEAACLNVNVCFFDDETHAAINRKGVNDVLGSRDLPTITIASWTEALQQG